MFFNSRLTSKFVSFLSDNKDVSVVCFDYFDTLVYRTVEPEQTKQLASNRLSFILNDRISGKALYQLRRDLEAKLCKRNTDLGKDLDFNLSDFCGHYYNILKKEDIINPPIFSRDEFRDILIDIEVAIEQRVQRICKDVVVLLEKARHSKIKTIIISDFYLPEKYFRKFLDYHRLTNKFDDVFVSSHSGFTKASGRLYDYVFETLHCRPSDLMMIGDNMHSDIKMADGKGMKTFFVNHEKYKLPHQKSYNTKYSHPMPLLEIKCKIKRASNRLGGSIFLEMGITLWRFIYLLFHQLVHNGVKNVFFFSKEGEFLKRLFEKFQFDTFGRLIINAHYLLVSRKSTYIGSLKPLPYETFSRIFIHYRNISARDFLLSLNIDENTAEQLCQSLSIDFCRRYEDFPSCDVFLKLINSLQFENIYERLRILQRANFTQYLKSFPVDIEREGLNIVDVGWKGSIQDNIFFSLNKSIVVCGYYLGLLIPTELSEKNRKMGILFSDTPNKSLFFNVYNSNRSLFEMILGATHGSAEGYFSSRSIDEIEKRENVYVLKRIHNGENEIYVATLDLPDERDLFLNQIQPIQDHIFNLFAYINGLLADHLSQQPDSIWFAKRHARMVFHPKRHEVNFYEKLYHLENFGIFEFTDFKSKKKLPIQKRIINLKNVIRNPNSVLETGWWAAIILRQLGLDFYRPIYGFQLSHKEFGKRIIS